MRTTLTIDDDVARALKELAHRHRTSFKAVVNEALRRGLAVGEKPAEDRPPFRVEAVHRGFRPGVDPLKLNQLADELEIEQFAARDHGTHPRRDPP